MTQRLRNPGGSASDPEMPARNVILTVTGQRQTDGIMIGDKNRLVDGGIGSTTKGIGMLHGMTMAGAIMSGATTLDGRATQTGTMILAGKLRPHWRSNEGWNWVEPSASTADDEVRKVLDEVEALIPRQPTGPPPLSAYIERAAEITNPKSSGPPPKRPQQKAMPKQQHRLGRLEPSVESGEHTHLTPDHVWPPTPPPIPPTLFEDRARPTRKPGLAPLTPGPVTPLPRPMPTPMSGRTERLVPGGLQAEGLALIMEGLAKVVTSTPTAASASISTGTPANGDIP